jgi:predicted MFS family arabinose efflux permease
MARFRAVFARAFGAFALVASEWLPVSLLEFKQAPRLQQRRK